MVETPQIERKCDQTRKLNATLLGNPNHRCKNTEMLSVQEWWKLLIMGTVDVQTWELSIEMGEPLIMGTTGVQTQGLSIRLV